MRALVTGSSGFVGTWLVRHLVECGDTVIESSADITDGDALAAEFAPAAPDVVFHLAGQADVGASWRAAATTFQVNAAGTLNVLETARLLPTVPRVLIISSADVYGVVRPEDLPIDEATELRPVTPYAASKVSAEFIGLQAFLGYGTPVIRARAFNHVGPGQGEGFVVSALAKRIVTAELEGTHQIAVGNLGARRDFSDVRDVVRAYRLIVERGTPGEVYNVCSGNDVAISDIAARLMAASGRELEFVVSDGQKRSVDVPLLSGDASKLRAATGWSPTIALDDTLVEVLQWWRTELARTR